MPLGSAYLVDLCKYIHLIILLGFFFSSLLEAEKNVLAEQNLGLRIMCFKGTLHQFGITFP